jgi:hypothetical protein
MGGGEGQNVANRVSSIEDGYTESWWGILIGIAIGKGHYTPFSGVVTKESQPRTLKCIGVLTSGTVIHDDEL